MPEETREDPILTVWIERKNEEKQDNKTKEKNKKIVVNAWIIFLGILILIFGWNLVLKDEITKAKILFIANAIILIIAMISNVVIQKKKKL